VAAKVADDINRYLQQRKDMLLDDNCLEKALLAVLADNYGKTEQKDTKKEVETPSFEFLKDLISKVPETPLTGGEIPVALPLRPKNMQEAGELARKMLSKKQN
jgi:predicted RNase H-like nuclease